MDEEALKALSDPKTYGPNVQEVRLLDTHSSWVFLTGEFAYKIKKPVNFGFLDYTTLERRKFFCEEEIRLNRLWAPEIYLGVVAITRDRGEVRLDGDGEVIEYAVRMRELPQPSIMTELLKRGEVGFSTVAKIAQIIADSHSRAETNSEIAQYGDLKMVKFNWDENFEQTERFKDVTIPSDLFETIKTNVNKFMGRKGALFLKRIRDGKIRRCHGDLHSGNIFITDKIYVFDCIEFNLRFSCQDVASDVAFLAMDLDFHDRKELSDHFIGQYIQKSGDVELLSLLDFYKCYRAYVRGKVTSFKLNAPQREEDEKTEVAQVARSYFELAHDYSNSLFEEPRLIIVSGLPGVGKTHIAKRLAKRWNWFHLTTDVIRKELAGLPIEEHYYGDLKLYSPEMSLKAYKEMLRRAEIYIRAGKGCILDATFNKREPREEAFQLAERLNIKAHYIHFICPEDAVLQRLQKRSGEVSASDATPEVYFKMKENFEPFEPYKPHLIIDTTEDLEVILKKIETLIFSSEDHHPRR